MARPWRTASACSAPVLPATSSVIALAPFTGGFFARGASNV